MINQIAIATKFERMQQQVRNAYTGRTNFPNLSGYTCAILHEAAHALMAYQHGLRVHHIRVTPWREDGKTGIFTVPLSWGAQLASETAAKILLAGFMADYYFQSASGSDMVCYHHDLWLALAALERGEVAAEELHTQFNKNRGDINTKEELRIYMRSAHAQMLTNTNPSYIERIRAKPVAKKELKELSRSVCNWVEDHLDALEYLVGFIARRREAGRNFNVMPALKKANKHLITHRKISINKKPKRKN